MPWDFGHPVPAVGSDGHPARLGLHRSRRLQARRAGARQGDPPRRHAERHPAAAGRHQSSTCVVRDSRITEVDRRTVTMNKWSQRRVELDRSGRGDARQLLACRRGSRARPSPSGTDVDRRANSTTTRSTCARSTDRFSSPRFASRSFAWTRHSRAEPAIAGAPLRRARSSAKYLFGGTMARRPGEVVDDARSRT